MTTRRVRIGILLFALATLACAVSAAASQVFKLQFDQAPLPPPQVLMAPVGTIVVPAGGWMLSLTATVNESDLVGVGGFGDDWGRTTPHGQVLLVSENPDGCPSWIEPRFRSGRGGPSCQKPAEQWALDETWLEVWPGPSRSREETSSQLTCAGRPQKWSFFEPSGLASDTGGGAKLKTIAIGPEVDDRRCYGRHPNLPNLVLLADAGPGIASDARFRRSQPAVQRNLAGFFENFGFAWRDVDRRRAVTASLVAPSGLFSSWVAIDTAVSLRPTDGDTLSLGGPDCSILLAVDGGPRFCEGLVLDSEPATTVLRAFLVAGEAPDALVDQDGDGVVAARDAVLAGYRLLSNEALLQVREHMGQSYFDADLDGDGQAAQFPIPGSPVDLTDPPP